jgi:ubiquinone biosynthesis protein COQ4
MMTPTIDDRKPMARKIEWRRAWRALRTLIADPERTEQVFVLTRALSGKSGDRVFVRFRARPEGRALLAERPSLLDALSDLDALERLPNGSFGRAYAAFMREGELRAAGLVEASMAAENAEDEEPDADRQWFFDRLRDMHDLWHVLTGYGRDEAGEAANLAFTFALTRHQGIGVIVLAAMLIGPKDNRLEWQRYLIRAWQRGRRAAWLPAVAYERLLDRPLEEVRAMLAIESPEKAHPQGILVGSRGDAAIQQVPASGAASRA